MQICYYRHVLSSHDIKLLELVVNLENLGGHLNNPEFESSQDEGV